MVSLKILVAFTGVLLLAGCAGNQPKLSATLQNALDSDLTCKGASECKLMWERATFYINETSGYKIQVYNDTIIQTFNSTEGSTKLAFSVAKEPLGNESYKMNVNAWCANMLFCRPNQYEAIAKAKHYMKTGVK